MHRSFWMKDPEEVDRELFGAGRRVLVSDAWETGAVEPDALSSDGSWA